ncbi:MAG: hypothetical protein AB9834_14005 [Lentimicrobium sp.]
MEEILSPEQWNALQIMLKFKFPELSDDDLHYHESYENDLLRMVGYSLKKDIVNMQGIFTSQAAANPPVLLRIRNRALVLRE